MYNIITDAETYTHLDIYSLLLIKASEDILDRCHTGIADMAVTVTGTMVQILTTDTAQSFTIFFTQNLCRECNHNLVRDKLVYIQYTSVHESNFIYVFRTICLLIRIQR